MQAIAPIEVDVDNPDFLQMRMELKDLMTIDELKLAIRDARLDESKLNFNSSKELIIAEVLKLCERTHGSVGSLLVHALKGKTPVKGSYCQAYLAKTDRHV